jgi:hypothetical protein
MLVSTCEKKAQEKPKYAYNRTLVVSWFVLPNNNFKLSGLEEGN